MRYSWAMQLVGRRRVADLGCGTGYGTYMLSWVAKEAVGFDVCPESIKFARRRFGSSVVFHVLDLEKDIHRMPLPFADVYVLFEVLEHLTVKWYTLYTLRSRGADILFSLPLNDHSPFHKTIYDRASTRSMITSLYRDAEMWMQGMDGLVRCTKPDMVIPDQYSNIVVRLPGKE
jgi:SAM-dependent methyltransferase